jgi:hypothetical protein
VKLAAVLPPSGKAGPLVYVAFTQGTVVDVSRTLGSHARSIVLPVKSVLASVHLAITGGSVLRGHASAGALLASSVVNSSLFVSGASACEAGSVDGTAYVAAPCTTTAVVACGIAAPNGGAVTIDAVALRADEQSRVVATAAPPADSVSGRSLC